VNAWGMSAKLSYGLSLMSHCYDMVYGWMTGKWWTGKGFGRKWSTYYLGICMEELRTTTNNFSLAKVSWPRFEPGTTK
jgi:hypothetical protein